MKQVAPPRSLEFVLRGLLSERDREDVSYIPARRVWQCKTRHPKNQFSAELTPEIGVERNPNIVRL
jgi:hypothetical protein